MVGKDKCVNELSQFYTQVFCMHSDEELEWRYMINVTMAIQLICITLIYEFFIFLIKRSNSTKFNEWDQETTTIADYTLKYTIPPSIYEKYKTEVFPTSGHENVNYGFSCFLKEEFEEIIRN